MLLLVEFQLVYKRLGPDSSSVMTRYVLVSFSGRILVVQEVLRTVIIAPNRKAILVLCRFCRCVVGTRDPGRCVQEIHIRKDYALCLALVIFSSTLVWILCFIVVVLMIPKGTTI